MTAAVWRPVASRAFISSAFRLANPNMTRNELIDRLSRGQPHLEHEDVALAVKAILDQMGDTLAHGQRIEIRGFGSFSLHRRKSRLGRNPRTGAPVALLDRQVPHFKPGKELRERVNARSEVST